MAKEYRETPTQVTVRGLADQEAAQAVVDRFAPRGRVVREGKPNTIRDFEWEVRDGESGQELAIRYVYCCKHGSAAPTDARNFAKRALKQAKVEGAEVEVECAAPLVRGGQTEAEAEVETETGDQEPAAEVVEQEPAPEVEDEEPEPEPVASGKGRGRGRVAAK